MSPTETIRQNDRLWTVIWMALQALVCILLTVGGAFLGWLALEVVDLKATINSAPTAEDQLEVWKEISAVRQDVVQLSARQTDILRRLDGSKP